MWGASEVLQAVIGSAVAGCIAVAGYVLREIVDLKKWRASRESAIPATLLDDLYELQSWRRAIEERMAPDRELRSEVPVMLSMLKSYTEQIQSLRDEIAMIRGEIQTSLHLITDKLDLCWKECPVKGHLDELAETIYHRVRKRLADVDSM